MVLTDIKLCLNDTPLFVLLIYMIVFMRTTGHSNTLKFEVAVNRFLCKHWKLVSKGTGNSHTHFPHPLLCSICMTEKSFWNQYLTEICSVNSKKIFKQKEDKKHLIVYGLGTDGDLYIHYFSVYVLRLINLKNGCFKDIYQALPASIPSHTHNGYLLQYPHVA